MPDDPESDNPTTGSGPDEAVGEIEAPEAIDAESDEESGHSHGELALQAAALRIEPPPRTGVFIDERSLRMHVGDLLRSFLGGYEVDPWGNFTFDHEGARVVVTIGMAPFGPSVGVFSVTNVDVPRSSELAEFLVTTNHTLALGAFSYDEDNSAVWFRHTLTGAMLDPPELQAAVGAVASTAAYFDDVIQARFGGEARHAGGPIDAGPQPPDLGPQTPNAGGYL